MRIHREHSQATLHFCAMRLWEQTSKVLSSASTDHLQTCRSNFCLSVARVFPRLLVDLAHRQTWEWIRRLQSCSSFLQNCGPRSMCDLTIVPAEPYSAREASSCAQGSVLACRARFRVKLRSTISPNGQAGMSASCI